MELEFILNMIQNKGYTGLFLWLWLGVFVFPVPNEVIIMTVGLATSLGVLHPLLAFIAVYSGIVAAITTSYLLGRLIGRPILTFFENKKRFTAAIDTSMKLMDKYHAPSLSFSYFVPGVRNFLPFLYGVSKLPFRIFALFAYIGAFIWLLIAFPIGYWFGEHIDTIVAYEQEMLLVLCGFAVSLIIIKMVRRKHAKKIRANESL